MDLDNVAFYEGRGIKDASFCTSPPAFSLKIACIVSNSLFYTIKHDATVLLLTPSNFEGVLKYVKIDFLLVESCVFSATKDWGYAQLAENELNSKMHEVIDLSTKLGIPTVFWYTNKDFYSKHLEKLIRRFDYIYTTSGYEEFVGNRSVRYLPEAIQPRLHNPFLLLGENVNNKRYIVDGLNEIDALDDKDVLSRFDFQVFDTTFYTLKKIIPGIKGIPLESIKGHVSRQHYLQEVKRSAACVSFGNNSNSISQKRLLQIEAAATGTPVLHLGKLDEGDIRLSCTIECKSINELAEEMVRVQDPLYRLRRGHRAFRYLHNNHTIAHRLQEICKNFGRHNLWEEYPVVTVACATNRTDFFEKIISTFERQSYPNKELLVVYNGTDNILNVARNLIERSNNRHFFAVPKGLALGGALNCAIEAAKGEYVLKIDDDDYYDENYILDLILAVRHLNVDIFGKPQVNFFRFEEEQSLYLRKNNRGVNYLTNTGDKRVSGKQIIIGNSIAARTEFLKKHPFVSGMLRHTDSMFFYTLSKIDEEFNIAVCDPFNMIVERRSDLSSHTWTMGKEQLQANCESNYSFYEAVL